MSRVSSTSSNNSPGKPQRSRPAPPSSTPDTTANPATPIVRPRHLKYLSFSDFVPGDSTTAQPAAESSAHNQSSSSSIVTVPSHQSIDQGATNPPKRSFWRTLWNSLHLGKESRQIVQTRSSASTPRASPVSTNPAGSAQAGTNTRYSSGTGRRAIMQLSSLRGAGSHIDTSKRSVPRSSAPASFTNRRPEAELMHWWVSQTETGPAWSPSAELRRASHLLAQQLVSQIGNARRDDRASMVKEFTNLVTLLYRSVHTTCLDSDQKNDLLRLVQLLNRTLDPIKPGTSLLDSFSKVPLKERLDSLESTITDVKGVPPDAPTVEWDEDSVGSPRASPSTGTSSRLPGPSTRSRGYAG
ncbi:hypothetical protein BCR39DRAFT_569933 [Naematelia encephala]|uniref:Uncharacterized protein n=1 Tax=Naematelia encephala TaxID=71784 RepID=A0A1Y2AFC0_9TREE|nr:hypothetical protein BCR39DRAFT_569933 [Naematelia encephala]